MSIRRMRIATPCPACHQPTLDYMATQLDVPYFQRILQTVFLCESCGFRHSDAIIGQSRTPQRSRFRTSSADDMMVRVVRSTSGTVRIPELGVAIEPGPASDAFVSNVEGVLVRVERVLAQLFGDAETDAEREKIQDLVDRIQRMKDGMEPMTLILEDPNGNSAILHDGVTIEPISADEAEQMPRGEITFDVSDLNGNGSGNGSGP